MLIKDTQLAVLKSFLICCLTGCTVTKNHNEAGNSIPVSWFPAVANTLEECVPIDGKYQTFGTGKYKEGEGLTKARLDAALGYVFPSEKIPENVSLSLDKERGLLNIQFGQPINRSFSTSVVCINNWHTVEQKSVNKYLGDGTTLDYSVNEFELGKSVDGDLIVHSSFDVQSSSFLITKSRDLGESWSKYEELKSED